MRRGWRIAIVLLGLFITAGHMIAEAACPAVVQQALDTVTTSCHQLGRNQACYGNLSVHATPNSAAATFSFDSVGDVIDVTDLKTLKLDPLNATQGIWGLAMMQLQADIPDTMPGQSVTFLLFGDVEIENRLVEGLAPMQAFYMRTGVGASACLNAPESGVLIQTPHGVESVNFNINGVNVEIGSTVMLQAQPEGSLHIRTLEGAAVVTMENQAYPVIAGTELSLPLDGNLQPVGLPSMPTPLADPGLNELPLAPLPRQIAPAAPLSDAAMTKLQMRLDSGLAPCGVPGLPACEHALASRSERLWAGGVSPEASLLPTDAPAALPTLVGNPVLTPVPTLVESTWEKPVVVSGGPRPTSNAGQDTSGGVGAVIGQSVEALPNAADQSVNTESQPGEQPANNAPPSNGQGNGGPPPSPPGHERGQGKGHDHHDHDDDDDDD